MLCFLMVQNLRYHCKIIIGEIVSLILVSYCPDFFAFVAKINFENNL